MQRFRFRLGGLLRLRSQLERMSRRVLAAATGNVTVVEQRIAAVGESLRQCEEHALGTGPSAQLARSLEQGLGRYRGRLQRELRAAEAQLDRARTDWLERRRDEQVLVRLRAAQRSQWQQGVLRHEQHEMEELARLRVMARTDASEVQ